MVPVTRIVATSWKYSPNLSNNLFFAMVDFDEGQEAFQIMKLNHAPCKEQTMDTLMHRLFLLIAVKGKTGDVKTSHFFNVTRLGDFLQLLGAKFLAKVAQIFSNNLWLL